MKQFLKLSCVVSVAALVAACGGGSNGGSPSTAQGNNGGQVDNGSTGGTGTNTGTGTGSSSTASAGPSDYLTVMIGQGNANQVANEITVYAFDDATPTTPVLTVQSTDISPGRPILVSAWSFNGENVSNLGSTMLVYVDHGVVKTIDLKKTASHTAVRVSNINDACYVSDYHGGGVQGRDVLVTVGRSGVAGNCSGGVKSFSYVRTSQAATEAPLPFPSGTTVITSMDDATNGKVNGYLALVGNALMIYSPDFSQSTPVTGLNYGVEMGEVIDGKTAFLYSGHNIYRVTQTGPAQASATLIHQSTAATGPNYSHWTMDLNNVYFCDGSDVFRAGATGDKVKMGSVQGNCEYSMPGPSGLVVSTDDEANSLWMLPYDGAPVSLGSHSGTPGVIGQTQSRVYYATMSTTSPSILKSVKVDGTDEKVITSRNGTSGNVHAVPVYKNMNLGRAALSSILYMDSPASVSTDGQSDFYQLNTADDSSIKLGTFNLSQLWLNTFGDLYDNQPWGFTGETVDSVTHSYTTDLYFVMPGKAGSMVRATNFVR